MMFASPFALHLNDVYWFFENVIEFFLFLFIRTRSSIKFYAKFITIINVSFLFYINSYMYAAQYAYFNMLMWLCITISFAFLEYFEIPAIQDWNPFAENTPRFTSPRIGY